MSENPTPYTGPERRRRRVYVTQNHEYHCKDGVCVAVRDLRSGEFLETHPALRKTVTVSIRMANGSIAQISAPEDARPGARAHFSISPDDRHDVLTSALTAVERPQREVVLVYEQENEQQTCHPVAEQVTGT